MNLNQLIDKLVDFRDKNNAGEFNVLTHELVWDVCCGEVQDVYREPIAMKDEDLVLDADNKIVLFCAEDNKTEI